MWTRRKRAGGCCAVPGRWGAPDRMEQLPAEFYEAVREGYLMLARDEPERFRVILASRSVETVEAEVWQHVQGLMGK
jgi:dTMP kinase